MISASCAAWNDIAATATQEQQETATQKQQATWIETKKKQSELSEKNKSNSVWSLEFLQLTRQQQQQKQKQQQHGFRSTTAALHAQRQQLLLLLLLSPVVNSMMISLLSQRLLSPFFSLQSPFTSTSHDMQMRLGNWLNWKCNRSNSTAATFDFSIRARVSSRCKERSTCLQIHTDKQPATCVIHHDTKEFHQFAFETTTRCPCGNHSFSHTVS